MRTYLSQSLGVDGCMTFEDTCWAHRYMLTKGYIHGDEDLVYLVLIGQGVDGRRPS